MAPSLDQTVQPSVTASNHNKSVIMKKKERSLAGFLGCTGASSMESQRLKSNQLRGCKHHSWGTQKKMPVMLVTARSSPSLTRKFMDGERSRNGCGEPRTSRLPKKRASIPEGYLQHPVRAQRQILRHLNSSSFVHLLAVISYLEGMSCNLLVRSSN